MSSDKFRVVLVEPEYEMNIGMTARAMKNFGFYDLVLVNPKCKIGRNAVKYAKHGIDVLKKAKITKSMRGACNNFDVVVGATAIEKRYKGTIRNVIPLRNLPKSIYGKTCLVFGREGTGLNEREIDSCDVLVKIETDKIYPALNLSHAVVIILYTLQKKPIGRMDVPTAKEKQTLFRLINSCMQDKKLRNKKKILVAFRRIFGRAVLRRNEVLPLLCFFRRLGKK